MTAVAYIRRSASGKAQASERLPRETVAQLASEHDDTIPVFKDWDRSGGSETRPQYLVLLALHRSPHPDPDESLWQAGARPIESAGAPSTLTSAAISSRQDSNRQPSGHRFRRAMHPEQCPTLPDGVQIRTSRPFGLSRRVIRSCCSARARA